MNNPPQLPPDGAPPKKRGCFFFGCLALLIVVLVLVGAIYLGYRYVVSTVSSFTDTKGVAIESVEATPAEVDSIRQRVEKFANALERQTGPEELVITARDINALIANAPEYGEAKGKVFVIIEGGKIKGRVSVPLTEDAGPLKVKGRYFNGTATFRIALTNGQPLMKIDNLEVNGRPLPGVVLNELRNKNFAEDFQKDPQAVKNLAKIESFQIRDDKIIIRNKVKP